jgi:hypothetical protein
LACDSVCYGGFLPDEGDTALIVASTGKGKSKLALQMTLNMCHQTYAGEPVVALYISFELGAGVLAQRAIQNLSGFPLGMARNNQYDERYFAGVDALSKLSLHLTYSTQSTIEAVISMITAFDNQQVANGKPVSRVVVIDSLNLMSVGNIGGKSSSNYDATANNASAQAAFSGAFKEFFKETKKVGLLVSQLKQTIGDSKNPTTLDVYGGSANPVDFAFALVDKGQESACQYALHVMKNRHGFTGAEFELFSDTRHNILLSLEPEALAKNYLYKPQTPTTYPTHSADEDVL